MHIKFGQFQNLTIFSDGSLFFKLSINSKNSNIIKNSNKDLKVFQKLRKENSSKSLSNFNSTNLTGIFRKKLFK